MNEVDKIEFKIGKSYPRIGSKQPKFCLDCMKMLVSTSSICRDHKNHKMKRIKEIVFV